MNASHIVHITLRFQNQFAIPIEDVSLYIKRENNKKIIKHKKNAKATRKNTNFKNVHPMAIRLNHFDHRVRPRHSLLPPLHLQQILEPNLQMENSIQQRQETNF